MFGITGSGTIVLGWLVALVTLTLVTLRWPRAAGPGGGAVLRRLTAQLLVLVVVLLAVGVSANRSGLWFVSWRDLFSVLTGPQLPPAGGDSAPTSTVGAPVDDPHVPGLRTYTVRGAASGYTGTVHVWMPGEDDAPGPGGRPVIQVLHGYPVSAQSAVANLRLPHHVSRLAEQDRLAGPVLLVPDWSPGEVDTECVNGPAVHMETWLATDLPAWARAELGASGDREAWATLGYSAGGWCAAMLAARHPQVYTAAITLGGYTSPTFSGGPQPFPASQARERGYDVVDLVRRTRPDIALLVQTSPQDTWSAPTTLPLLEAAGPPTRLTGWVMPDVGHRVGAWEPLVPASLAWLAGQAPGFAAG